MISCLEICDSGKVEGFGRYEVLPPEELASGKPRKVQVYCELQNFKSDLNDQGKYLTRLKAEITLYDANWRVKAQLAGDVPDVPSYRPRRDFFLRAALDIPALAPGKYQLEVRIEDTVAKKIARPLRRDFEVKAPTNYVR